jgi:alpha-glucosidase
VCDHPKHYRDQPGADFLRLVPTVWNDTRVLEGEVGQYLVMARQSGEEWFLGALTNSQAREVSIKLDFLGPGTWTIRQWNDGVDAVENAEHLAIDERTVSAGDMLHWRLAPAGGGVARLQRQ